MKYALAILLGLCLFTFGCDSSGVYVPPATPTENPDDPGTNPGNDNGDNGGDNGLNGGGNTGGNQNDSSGYSGKKAPHVYSTPEVK